MEYELARTVAMPVAPAGSVRQVDRVARLGALCDGIATAAVLGALFLLPITIFPFAESLFTLPKAMVLQYLAVFAVAASALKLVVGRQIQLRRSPLDLPIAAYLGFVAISVLHASSRDAALFGPNERADGFITLLSAVALYFVAYNLPGGGSMLRWGMRAAVLSATLVAVEGIAESLGFSLIGLNPERFEFRAHGTTGNPTYLGGLLVLALPMAAALLATESRARRPAWALAIGLMGTALFATYSRGPWLACAVAVAVLLILAWRDLRHLWRWLLPPLAATLLFAFLLEGGLLLRQAPAATPQPPAVLAEQQPGVGGAEGSATSRSSGFDRMKTDSTGTGRLLHWQAALEVVREQPLLGAGYGNLYTAIMRYEPPAWYAMAPGVWVDKAHNAYLDLAASIGIPGTLAYLWLLGSLALAMGRYLLRAGRSRRRLLVAAVAAALAGYLVHLFFLFDSLENLALFWILAGLALREMSENSRAHSLGIRMPVVARAPLALGVLAGAGLALYWFALPVAADVYSHQGFIARDEHRVDQFVGLFLKAADLNPASATVQSAAASALIFSSDIQKDSQSSRHLLDRAVRLLNASIQRDPEFANLYVLRGEIYLRYGNGERLVDALIDFRRATELYPDYYDAYAAIAEVAPDLGLLGEAVAAERKQLQLKPNDPTVLAQLAQNLGRSGRWQEALKSWEQIIGIAGDSATIHMAMAGTLMNAGQRERAIAELDKAQQLDPGNEQVSQMRQEIQDNGR